jgi:tetratricopeptide (TPR) repeat protein
LSCAAPPPSPCGHRYAEAERRFKEAIEEAKLGFPSNDPHIPSALHYLAEFYRNMGRLDEAEPLYRQVRVWRVCVLQAKVKVHVPMR